MSSVDSKAGIKPKRLEGWKEIAEFLNVSERTARNWERDLGLPVRRLTDSGKPRVWASAIDLAAWQASQDSATRAEQNFGNGGYAIEATCVAEPTVPKQSRTRLWVGIGVATTVLVSLGAVMILSRSSKPAGVRVVQNTLKVVTANGRESWSYVFPFALRESFYNSPRSRLSWIISETARTGHEDLLFVAHPDQALPANTLWDFDEIGNVRWQFHPGKKVVSTRGQEYVPPYSAQAVGAARSPGSKVTEVIVTSVHNWSFPTQVAVLDEATGRVISEYWHHGHLNHLGVTDLDGDRESEVLLGGVDDSPEYAGAALIVFDHRFISGASQSPDGAAHFLGMTAGTEKAIVRFPRSPLSEHLEFNRVSGINLTGDRIVVAVAEGVSEMEPAIVYELNKDLTPVNVGLSDTALNRYLQMRESNPKLPSPTDLALRLKAKIHVWRRK